MKSGVLKAIVSFVKKETVLVIAWILAIVSAFFVPPSKEYISYIDFRSLGILWALMIIMAGLKANGLFDSIGRKLLAKTHRVWQLALVLVMLCFFFSMFITNDVALITFVPFAIFMLEECGRDELMIPVIVLQTLAANLGSMLTPIGNPQNLYLYGLSGYGMGEFLSIMLPYTLVTFVLLLVSVGLMKGKRDEITCVVTKQSAWSFRNLIYFVLFALSLLVVARVIPSEYAYIGLVAIVLVVVLIMDRKTLVSVDYALLFTFIGFFIFTGNLGQLPAINQMLTSLVNGREVYTGIAASQVISNVPAALLLSGFTTDYKSLIVGVNLGGLGTLIASMASLISYKSLAHAYNEKKGKYFLVFTGANVLYLFILIVVYLVL